jgi:hypothetical protein
MESRGRWEEARGGEGESYHFQRDACRRKAVVFRVRQNGKAAHRLYRKERRSSLEGNMVMLGPRHGGTAAS